MRKNKKFCGILLLMSEPGGGEIQTPPFKSEVQPSPEVVNLKPHCLFISGGKGTNAGIRGIKEGLEKQYGVGRVEAFNSVYNFEDPQNPNRFNEMADFIQEHAKEGLDIVAHSLGAAELKKAIDKVKARDREFFENEENTKNLHIILIAPSGFLKGIAGPIRFLTRTVRFAREQSPKSNTLLRGIDALTAFPPEGIAPEDLIVALREAMPELSQYQKDQKSFSLDAVASKDNFVSHLSDAQKEEIADYSALIRSAIENRNYDVLRDLVKEYGEKFRKPLAEIYAGSFELEEEPILEATRISILSAMGGYIGLMNTLIKGFGSKTMEEFADLERKGVKLDLVISEYDVLMRLKEAIAFFNGSSTDASQGVHLVQGVAHAFPALQAIGFGEMIKNLGENEVS
ncbi:MAG: hypothetical protein HYW62_02995 [Candidatus Levybacteria bacterium]|nr:hypothetical protein [Candidatus Levybacteria bacterium]